MSHPDDCRCEDCLVGVLREKTEALLFGDGVPEAPTGTQRHPLSNKKETARKSMIRCQNCLESKDSGVTLFKCAACKIDYYCSKECQRSDWPRHKDKCKLNRQHNDDADMAKLRAFTMKYMPAITQAAMHGMRLWEDPTRSTRDIVLLTLRPRPGENRPETAFFVLDAEVTSIDTLGVNASQFKPQMVRNHEHAKKVGGLGMVLVVLWCADGNYFNGCSVGYRNDIYSTPRIVPKTLIDGWRAQIIRKMNNGILE